MGSKLFEVRGDKDVIAALRALGEKDAKRVSTHALKKAAQVPLAQAQANMPVDTGAAQEGLSARRARNTRRNARRVAFEIVWAQWQDLQARTVPDDPGRAKYPEGFFYPATIEYGSEALNRPAAAPLRRSYESTRDAATAVGLRELAKGIDRAARRAARKAR